MHKETNPDIKPPQIKVKICGLDRPEILSLCIQEGADYAGLVFFPPSPRHLSVEKAAEIAAVKSSEDTILLTGLFVNPTPSEIKHVLADVPLNCIQLHGQETIEQIKTIRSCFDIPIIKAVPVAALTDLAASRPYDDVADILLFDAKPGDQSSRPGGLGKKFNWSLMTSWTGQKPWLLAGGLTEANLGIAQRDSHASGFDVSSHVESELGVKSADKVRSFLRTARSLC